MSTKLKIGLWSVAVLGTVFQAGHFTEHAIQAHEWLFTDRTKPWMSDIAMWLSMHMGATMPVGMELLHLTGNLIFLVTLAAWCILMTPNNLMRKAFLVEAFHLTEHINLTATVLLYGKAVGWSTLFGYAPMLFGHDGAVGFRVLWHFGMNLIPSLLMLVAMLPKSDAQLAAMLGAHVPPCPTCTRKS